MTKYVAMLRGIGPGDPNMTHEKFTAFFTGLGFSNVQVVLGSGNIIFHSPSQDQEALAQQIEKALPEQLGFSRSVIIRSEAELQVLLEADPFKDIEAEHNKTKYLLLTFFRQASAVPLMLPNIPSDKPFTLLGITTGVLAGVVDLSRGKTPEYMVWLDKQFGKAITSRTPKTIRLILSRMARA